MSKHNTGANIAYSCIVKNLLYRKIVGKKILRGENRKFLGLWKTLSGKQNKMVEKPSKSSWICTKQTDEKYFLDKNTNIQQTLPVAIMLLHQDRYTETKQNVPPEQCLPFPSLDSKSTRKCNLVSVYRCKPHHEP
jgi:hypothetical protein